MSSTRVLLSVVAAWAAWVLGLVVLSSRGMDFVLGALRREAFTPEALVGLLCIVLGSLLLASAAASLLLSWVGLLSVGVVHGAAALATGFLWSSSGLLLPPSLTLGLLGQHLFLGIHLVLGLLAVGLALAALLRRGRGPATTVSRLASLVAVPVAMVAGVLLVAGAGRNIRSLQTFQTVGLALVLVVLAALLLGLVAASTRLSGLGAAAAGGAWTVVAVVLTLWPTTAVDVLPRELFQGYTALAVSGGLLPIGLLLLVGGLVVPAVARQARGAGQDGDAASAHATGTSWGHSPSTPTPGPTP